MIRSFSGIEPILADGVYIAESAEVIGRVTLGERANIWFGAVLRGDDNAISIGKHTNIQDLCVLHISHDHPCVIGDNVTVGHRAILHGCTVGNGSLIGMGAIVLDGAVIEDQAMVGAGSLVAPGKRIPSRHLAVGSPARVIRELTEEEIQSLRQSAEDYADLADKYREGGSL